jgi:hypothetical protein
MSSPLIWELFNEGLNSILWDSQKHRILDFGAALEHLDQMEPKLLHHPPHSINRLALPPTSLHQSFSFPTQIARPPTEIWLMNSRFRCTGDNADLGLWHVNLRREHIRALQCPPDGSEIQRGGFCDNWIQRIWLNSHERLQTWTKLITFWDLLRSHVHDWEQTFDPPQKSGFKRLRPARCPLIVSFKRIEWWTWLMRIINMKRTHLYLMSKRQEEISDLVYSHTRNLQINHKTWEHKIETALVTFNFEAIKQILVNF